MKETSIDNFKEISRMHVFTGGTPTTGDYTEDVLDGIVKNFNELKDAESAKLRPVLKLTHSEDQESIWKKLGVLGSGFISGLSRDGLKLYADISNVPDPIAAALESGDINNQPSVEIYRDFQDADGKAHGPALRAVSLLIDEIPKVKGLEGYAAIYEEKVHSEYSDLRAFAEEEGVDTYAIGLKEEMDIEDKVDEVRNDLWKVAGYRVENKMSQIMKEEITADEKKAQLEQLKTDAADLIAAEIDKLIASFAENEPAASAQSVDLKAEFVKAYGYDPEDGKRKLEAYAEKERKGIEEARKASVAAFEEDLRSMNMAPVFIAALVGLKDLSTSPVAKFAEMGDALDNFAELLKNKREALWVPANEMAGHSAGNEIQTPYDGRDDVNAEALSLDKQARVLMSEDSSLTYRDAVYKIMKNKE